MGMKVKEVVNVDDTASQHGTVVSTVGLDGRRSTATDKHCVALDCTDAMEKGKMGVARHHAKEHLKKIADQDGKKEEWRKLRDHLTLFTMCELLFPGTLLGIQKEEAHAAMVGVMEAGLKVPSESKIAYIQVMFKGGASTQEMPAF